MPDLPAADPPAFLSDVPQDGLADGILTRAGLRDVVHVWGLEIGVPKPPLTDHERWMVRTGRYERAEAWAAAEVVDPDRPVVELGGGIGVVSCVVNRELRSPGDHVVLEMDPDLVPILEDNRDRNDARYAVRGGAIWYGKRSPRLDPERGAVSHQAPASSGGGVEVEARTLADLVEGFDGEVNLVSDVEGQEMALVREEPEVLRERVATIVAELHPRTYGPSQTCALVDEIRELGFEPVFQLDNVLGFRRTR